MKKARTRITTDADRLAELCKALAHPARVAIMKFLIERNACVCGEIVEVMSLAQSTVSEHLRVLKEAGLVKGTIDGPRVCYCVDRDAVATLEQQLGALFSTKERKAARP